MKNKVLATSLFILFMVLGSFEETIPTETIEPEEDIIRWKQEVSIEELEIDTVKAQTFYNVPLSEELQLHIFKECEKHNISPSVVIAIIEQESDYNENAVGDNGNSFGLMQVYKHYHLDRMDKLGCDNLLDPFQNVTVGIDYLAELKDINDDLYWVLMVYNGGFSYSNERMETGNYSDYAIEVAERIAELEKEV